jgi:4-hydroxymandelate oxidase
MKEIRDRARELLKGYCRVCPVCDGRVCAGEVPGMGGVGNGASFKANLEALGAVKLNLRTLHEISEPSTEVSLLGQSLSLPVMAAPIAGMRLNFGGVMPEDKYALAVAQGCLSAGTLGMLGDGPHEELFKTILTVLEATGGRVIPVIKPWEDKELLSRLEQVAKAGAPYAVVDVDAAGFIHLRRQGTPVLPRTGKQWSRIIAQAPLSVALKGVMTPDEALQAAEAGAAGVVVSNHGGRVLEGSAGTAEVLPAVAGALKGKIALMVDGGVRSGVDALKMLALGAEAVLIGRPLAVAAIGGAQEGVKKYLTRIRFELIQAMILTGCPRPEAATSSLIWPRPRKEG